jgi:hypothetical protein
LLLLAAGQRARPLTGPFLENWKQAVHLLVGRRAGEIFNQWNDVLIWCGARKQVVELSNPS